MKHYLHQGGRMRFALMLLILLAAGFSGSGLKALSGAVAGKVFLDGKPAAGATVSLYLLGKPHATTTADALGHYKIDGIWMGKYDVEATLGTLKTRVKDIVIKLTETTQVDLYLVSPTPVTPQPTIVEKEEHLDAPDKLEPIEFISMDEAVEEEAIYDIDMFGGGDFGGTDDIDGSEITYYGYTTRPQPLPVDREGYDHIAENRFHDVLMTPLSTFGIDVDAASYTNCRRMLLLEQRLPPTAAVRAEEFINYFDYDYPQPTGAHPFSITTELSACPWNPGHQLVHIGLQGKRMDMSALPPANLVFLVDVSGSMDEPNKLPLVKQGLALLVEQLRPEDRVAIVVYAGAAGLVLPSTGGNQKAKILEALEQLSAGGSTVGGAGIQLAYNTARENMRKGSNNRVILCTDGDFNVGVSSDGELVSIIEKERETGISLSVLGFGRGNYQDAKMEKLADNGNGNYAYIDQLLEAKRVFVNEVGGTLNTIAKDVKLQVEFNPAKVKSYRLIGYENRHLEAEDFDDDKKDAGELGAGHSVTALYEIEPAVAAPSPVGALRYLQQSLTTNAASAEFLTVKFRYKAPNGDVSQLIEHPCAAQPIELAATSENFRFSAAVAAFAMLLRESEHKGNATFEQVLAYGRAAKGVDANGYRAEFLKLVETAALLTPGEAQR